MSLHIVADVRRVRDFGIGTYIRSLVHALACIDQTDRFTLVALPEDASTFSGVAANFKNTVYRKADAYFSNHISFPLFLWRLRPSLVHLPLHQVPLFMR